MFNSYEETLTYVAEITQPSLRGILASTSTVAVISGILAQFLLGTFLPWRKVALCSCAIPVLSFLLLFLVPESPHWLISKKRSEEARKSLAWLRGWLRVEEIESEFTELSQQISKSTEHTKTSLKLYTRKNFLWPFGLVSFAFFLGHFSGMTTLQTYAVTIFATLKSPIDKYYATIFLGVAEVAGCVLSASLVHFAGKRKMNFLSLFGSGVCFSAVATLAHFSEIKFIHIENAENLASAAWLPTALLIAAAFFTHTGIRILPWMLVGEVYSNQTRASASGLSGAASYIFGFVSNKIFLKMVSTLTLPGTFWMYSSLSFLGIIILYFILPETEGKTLFEITEHFANRNKLDNKVQRKAKIPRIPSQARNGKVNKGFSYNENESRF